METLNIQLMEPLIIAGTEDTPEINFDLEGKRLTISGRSLPEDVTAFYQPVFAWLDRFAALPAPAATMDIRLEYFNTASSKILLDIFMKLEEISESESSDVKVRWYFDENDEDMQEAGEEYHELVAIDFDLIGY
jgi:hypothetical protein